MFSISCQSEIWTILLEMFWKTFCIARNTIMMEDALQLLYIKPRMERYLMP